MRANDSAKLAWSEAIRRSQASARFKPAPAAGPLTAAMDGNGSATSLSIAARPASIRGRSASAPAPRCLSAAMWWTSPPAENARPAPVTTRAPIPPRAEAASSAAMSCSRMSSANALRRSGRLRTRVATPSASASRIKSGMAGPCRGVAGIARA